VSVEGWNSLSIHFLASSMPPKAVLAHAAIAAIAIVSRPLIGWSPPRELLETVVHATIEPKGMSIENLFAPVWRYSEHKSPISENSGLAASCAARIARATLAHSRKTK